MRGAAAAVVLLFSSLFSAAAEARVLDFSGYQWQVKSSPARMGPGPNYFSDSTENVWVDPGGRLHLRITRQRGRWNCAEIISMQSFGYGTYRFYLDSAVGALDPNVVFGLFTWSDNSAYSHREIDIEFSRSDMMSDANVQYVVQPYTDARNLVRWQMPGSLLTSTHSVLWQPDRVFFQSLAGHYAVPPDPSIILQQAMLTSGVPPAGDENARINLWLFQGWAPIDKKEVEVIISRFEFTPA
jgi:hypothetical protein